MVLGALQGFELQAILPETDRIHNLWSCGVYGIILPLSFVWIDQSKILQGYMIFWNIWWICFDKAWEGDGVVASARKLIGATNPLQAEPGTIRGDLAVQTGRWGLFFSSKLCCWILQCFYSCDIEVLNYEVSKKNLDQQNCKKKVALWSSFCRNVVHGSDSPENGKREIGKSISCLLNRLLLEIFCFWNGLMVLSWVWAWSKFKNCEFVRLTCHELLLLFSGLRFLF